MVQRIQTSSLECDSQYTSIYRGGFAALELRVLLLSTTTCRAQSPSAQPSNGVMKFAVA